MTVQERQEIFAKEYLSNADFCRLYDLSPGHASEMMNDIKRKLTIGQGKQLRMEVKGRLHILDYLDWLGVTSDRYGIKGGSGMTVQELLQLKRKYKAIAKDVEYQEEEGYTEKELDAVYAMGKVGVYGASHPTFEVERFFAALELLLRAEDK